MRQPIQGFIGFALIVLTLVAAAPASVVFEDGFGSADGNLVGTTPTISTGNWGQTGATTTNPIQISSNRASLTTTGQDTFAAFSGPVAHTDGNAIYTSAILNLSAAQAAGDYFLHLSDPAGTTSNFYQRLFAKSGTSGYLLGLSGSSGGTTPYGTAELSFNTNYKVVIAWNFVNGLLNDTFAVYVDPTDAVEGNNTAYLSVPAWGGSTGAEPANISAANLRQGSATNAATPTVDNLLVGTAFADMIPEPGSFSLLGVAALAAFRRRK
jgi:trimeric autotransporter adhesin